MYLDVKVRLSNKFWARHLVIDLKGKRAPVFLLNESKKGRARLGVHPNFRIQLGSILRGRRDVEQILKGRI
jgi:hypothetical protein